MSYRHQSIRALHPRSDSAAHSHAGSPACKYATFVVHVIILCAPAQPRHHFTQNPSTLILTVWHVCTQDSLNFVVHVIREFSLLYGPVVILLENLHEFDTWSWQLLAMIVDTKVGVVSPPTSYHLFSYVRLEGSLSHPV